MDHFDTKDVGEFLLKIDEELQKRMTIWVKTVLKGLAFQRHRIAQAKECIKDIRSWGEFLERYSPEEVIEINLWERNIPMMEAEIDEMEEKINRISLEDVAVFEEYLACFENLNRKFKRLYSILLKGK